MAEESCVTYGQDSFFVQNHAVRSAAAAEQIIAEQHTDADDQKTDEITRDDPH